MADTSSKKSIKAETTETTSTDALTDVEASDVKLTTAEVPPNSESPIDNEVASLESSPAEEAKEEPKSTELPPTTLEPVTDSKDNAPVVTNDSETPPSSTGPKEEPLTTDEPCTITETNETDIPKSTDEQPTETDPPTVMETSADKDVPGTNEDSSTVEPATIEVTDSTVTTETPKLSETQQTLNVSASSEATAVPDNETVVVIIAVDGSEYSDYAMQFYSQKMHKPNDHVIIVHSSEYKSITRPATSIFSGEDPVSQLARQIETEDKITEELVAILTAKFSELKLEAEIMRIYGEAGPAIVHLADEKHADYVIVGCRGKGTIRRTFTGSVADYVTHHSHVPVMIARHKEHVKKHHHGFHLNPFHQSRKHKHNGEKHANPDDSANQTDESSNNDEQ